MDWKKTEVGRYTVTMTPPIGDFSLTYVARRVANDCWRLWLTMPGSLRLIGEGRTLSDCKEMARNHCLGHHVIVERRDVDADECWTCNRWVYGDGTQCEIHGEAATQEATR